MLATAEAAAGAVLVILEAAAGVEAAMTAAVAATVQATVQATGGMVVVARAARVSMVGLDAEVEVVTAAVVRREARHSDMSRGRSPRPRKS